MRINNLQIKDFYHIKKKTWKNLWKNIKNKYVECIATFAAVQEGHYIRTKI